MHHDVRGGEVTRVKRHWKVAAALGAAIAAVVAAGAASPARSAASQTGIYWGSYIEGPQTYGYLYGGTWRDAPWDSNTWSTFDKHAGKKAALIHWGVAPWWAHSFNFYKSTFGLVRNAGDLNAVDMSTGSMSLAGIASGKYDSSITTWFEQAAAWGHPFFLILDVEMNGSWEPYAPGRNGNTAADFVAMWRHVHALADAAGAKNVTWVWAPNVDPTGRFAPYWQLYPGRDYVDWTGLDGFNDNGNESFAWLYGSSYKALLKLAPAKPIMITQMSSIEGGIGKAAWITDALSTQLPTNFPQIKALLWFNWRFYQGGRWLDYEIESSKASRAAFAAGIASPYYFAGGTFGDLTHQKVPIP